MEKIGLIAGNRRFPILFSQAAKKKGCQLVAVGIRGDTSAALKRYVDKLYWIGLSDFEKMFEIFKREGVSHVVMAGQISPHRLFSREVTRSKTLQQLLDSLADRRADTIFGAIAQQLQERGFTLIDSTTYLEDSLPDKGILTRHEPDFDCWEDIYFGFDIAKEVAYLDIGQTVAVKGKAVVAVEALEGTDNLIRRARTISRSGFSVIKVSKPKQDARFDIPVVGLVTVKNLVRAKARCLALEAKKTLFIDKDISISLANRKGLSIVAI